MATHIVRRLYIYAAAFLGLQLAAAGARGTLRVLLAQLFGGTRSFAPDVLAATLSLNAALLLVGLPLWAGHWFWVQRALSAPEERLSALRRLYGYAVLLVAMLGLVLSLHQLLEIMIGRETNFNTSTPTSTISAIVVWAALWLYHWRVLSADRLVVERASASATLRRWYMVLIQAVSLGLSSYAAIDLLHALIQLALTPAIGDHRVLETMPGLITGLAIWLPHYLWSRWLLQEHTPIQADEAHSTLRPVYMALVLTITAVSALGALTVLLDEVLLAAFGGSTWSAILLDHPQALAVLIIMGGLWWYHRHLLIGEARLSEVEARIATAWRIAGYLMSAIGLGALFFGVGGLISTLLRLALVPDIVGVSWREPLCIYLALAIVALPVYGLTARAIEARVRAVPQEERALARRVYLYAALLFGIVSVVIAGVLVLQQGLHALLGTADVGVATEFGRRLGYMLVGAVITAYYALLLRRAGAIGSDIGAGLTIAIVAEESLRSMIVTTFERELPGATLQVAQGQAAIAAALDGAQVLITTIDAALVERGTEALHQFSGRRLLLATSSRSYELIDVQRDASIIARAAARTLRASIQSAHPIAPAALATSTA